MPVNAVKKYLVSSAAYPFFLVTGDTQYEAIKDRLTELSFAFIRVSTYCSDNDMDKLPDIDRLIEKLTAEGIGQENRLAVIGLGEHLAFCGTDEARKTLLKLKDLGLGNKKVVFLLRGMKNSVKKLQASDARLDARRVYIDEPAESDVAVTILDQSIGLSVLTGYKKLLGTLENGASGPFAVNTRMKLEQSIYTIRVISSAYDGVKFVDRNFLLPKISGNDEQWAYLLTELTENGQMEFVLAKYGIQGNFEALFDKHIMGMGFSNWLYFIALKQKQYAIQNTYLKHVLAITESFPGFRYNVLHAIAAYAHDDQRFINLYNNRKSLVKNLPESEIASFVVENRRDVKESIYRLTDNTKVEREEIIAWVAQHGMIPQAAELYPALGDYMKKFTFSCKEIPDFLTSYFDDYKRQKVLNRIEDYHLALVAEQAQARDYNWLRTRNEKLDEIEKEGAYLYWLDALGVEYLAFISEACHKRGLSLSIKIARAELPTITTINNGFYSEWQGKKESTKRLDEIKHKAEGGYNFEDNKYPIHLAEELTVLTQVIEKAATKLALRECSSFVIISDHGASRLAVLKMQEEKYETETKGVHSGRCCKYFEPYELPNATPENGYLVLADYGRFKGSRAASVEVHGGASLEEVVVPVIVIKLKDSQIGVELVDKKITASYRKSAEVTLFSKDPLHAVSIVVNGKRYMAEKIDANHYTAVLGDIKRAGAYTAEVYQVDDLIDRIALMVQNESGKKNDAFDDLF